MILQQHGPGLRVTVLLAGNDRNLWCVLGIGRIGTSSQDMADINLSQTEAVLQWEILDSFLGKPRFGIFQYRAFLNI